MIYPEKFKVAGISMGFFAKQLPLALTTLLVASSGSLNAQPAALAGPGKPQAETWQAPFILHLSDVHLTTSSETTTYGQDTGMALWRALKAKLQSVIEGKTPPAFIIFTGDLPAHYECTAVNCYLPPGQRTDHNTNIKVLLEDLRSLVAKIKIPLFFIPGNNDGLAGDYFSFADGRQKTALNLVPEADNPYPALNTATACGEPPCLLADPQPKMGYYSARPINGLRLIGLNTIIWGNTYWPVDGISQREAGNTQMLWLEEQLKQAAEAGEKVYLLMHIPPGVDAYAASKGSTTPLMWASLPAAGMTWQDQFLRLINRYSSNVAGLFYGHTHMDELRLLYDRNGTKVSALAISSPGITPLDSNNPGFKLVFFEPKSKELIDFTTYYTTPTATSWGDASYQFSKVYGCEAQSMLTCLKQQNLEQINSKMQTIFMVKNGTPSYATAPGIPVKFAP
jgi:sphingomyelin phosphodiesterase acid-like 3